MRVLTWFMDSVKTTSGKAIATVLAFALVFSFSNICIYSFEAFAEGGAQAATEEVDQIVSTATTEVAEDVVTDTSTGSKDSATSDASTDVTVEEEVDTVDTSEEAVETDVVEDEPQLLSMLSTTLTAAADQTGTPISVSGGFIEGYIVNPGETMTLTSVYRNSVWDVRAGANISDYGVSMNDKMITLGKIGIKTANITVSEEAQPGAEYIVRHRTSTVIGDTSSSTYEYFKIVVGEIVMRTVSFDANGISATVPADAKIKSNSDYTLPAGPESVTVGAYRYDFTGWSTDKNAATTGETVYRSGDVFFVSESAKFFAIWNKVLVGIPDSVITYNASVEGYPDETEPCTFSTKSEEVAASASSATGCSIVTKPGYIFLGWFDGNTMLNSEYSEETGSHTFVPTKPTNGWTDKTYTAKFQKDLTEHWIKARAYYYFGADLEEAMNKAKNGEKPDGLDTYVEIESPHVWIGEEVSLDLPINTNKFEGCMHSGTVGKARYTLAPGKLTMDSVTLVPGEKPVDGVEAQDNVFTTYVFFVKEMLPQNLKDLSYSVHYYKDGSEVYNDAQFINTKVHKLDPDTLDINKSQINTEDKYVGYKLGEIKIIDKDNNEKIVTELPDKIDTESTIQVRYVKDDDQRQDTEYVVKHVTVLDGKQTEQASDVYTDTAWINDNPAMIAIQDGSLDKRDYTGYKFQSISVSEDTTEVKSGTIITLTYVKDDSAIQPTEYTVEHITVLDGERTVRDTQTYESSAWINDDPAMIAIEESSLDQKEYTGYKFESVSIDTSLTEVESGTTITFIYVVDEEATQDTKYTVKHVVAGKEQTDATKEYTSTAWINDDPAMIAIEEGSLVENKYTGYKFSRLLVNGETVSQFPESVESDSVITFVYEKDASVTHAVLATVHYFYGNTIEDAKAKTTPDATDSTMMSQSWIGDEATVSLEPNTRDKFTGYVFAEMDGTYSYSIAPNVPGTSGTHITKVYYVKDETQRHSLAYKLEFYKDGELQQGDTYSSEVSDAWLGDTITLSIDKGLMDESKYIGYALDTNLSGIADEISLGANEKSSVKTLRIDYVKDETQQHSISAQVRYFYGITADDAASKTEPDAVDDVITATGWIGEDTTVTVEPNESDKFVGYKFLETSGSTKYTIAAEEPTDEDAIINVDVIYIKDDSQTQSTSYTVKHLVADEEQIDDTKTYESNAWINDEDPMIEIVEDSLEPKAYEGYKFDKYMVDGVEIEEVPTQVASGAEIALVYAEEPAEVVDPDPVDPDPENPDEPNPTPGPDTPDTPDTPVTPEGGDDNSAMTGTGSDTNSGTDTQGTSGGAPSSNAAQASAESPASADDEIMAASDEGLSLAALFGLEEEEETVVEPITPMAASIAANEAIGDNANPLTSFDASDDAAEAAAQMLLTGGGAATALYGAGVLVSRLRFARKLGGFESSILGTD